MGGRSPEVVDVIGFIVFAILTWFNGLWKWYASCVCNDGGGGILPNLVKPLFQRVPTVVFCTN